MIHLEIVINQCRVLESFVYRRLYLSILMHNYSLSNKDNEIIQLDRESIIILKAEKKLPKSQFISPEINRKRFSSSAPAEQIPDIL